ncbi:DUF262 domain-containing protein [Microbacterium sp. NPDC077057]|uniref:DUF262 domain-containing protein n=1 Tax=unclassified Microbacterium TaxID=2609290 RepID=UPI003442CE2A
MTATTNQRFLSATMHTVSWFWKRFKGDELILQPPFQRNPVWGEKQKAALIDTILKGYPIPELYLQTTVDASGDEKHVVVDGQQRIRACLEFLSDGFPLGEDSGTLSGSTFEDLTPEQKQTIFEYKFVIRELPALSEPEIREIFGRLNRNNVVLNAQELRHATYWGEFISSMKAISQNEFWVTSGVFTVNDIRRMLDVEFISEISAARLYGLQNKKTTLDKFYKTFEVEFPDRSRIEHDFATVLGELAQILTWPTKSRWKGKTDFYTLFLVLAKHEGDMPFDRETRDTLASRLQVFSDSVSAYLSDVAPDEQLLQARGYARGVRASSDLGSRRTRDTALESYLFDLPYVPPADVVEEFVAGLGPDDQDEDDDDASPAT